MNFSVKLTQLNGWISDIFSHLTNFMGNFFSAIFGAIFMFLYQILVCPLFLIADAIQMMFRKFAGLDTYYVGNQSQSGDIVLSLINNQTVQNVFWALLILGVVLLIICTIVALIKTETQAIDDKNRKSKSKIFSESVRALFNFFMVPVVAILGVFMGNALLRSLDSATSGGVDSRISTIVFKTSAYECNRARLHEKFALDIRDKDMNSMGVLTGTDQEEIALAIDNAFANFTKFDKWRSLNLGSIDMFSGDGVYVHKLTLIMFSLGSATIPREGFSVYDAQQVYYYYDLSRFHFIICLIGIIFVIYVLFITAVGLIKRMFKLTILLMVSPPIVAISPLDNGTALGKWKKAFLSSTLAAYSTVVGLNLVFLLLGPISNIQFFQGVITGMQLNFLNALTTLLITIGALLFFKDFTKELGEIIGAEDAYAAGGKVASDASKKVAKAVTAGIGVVGGIRNKQNAAAMDTDIHNASSDVAKYKEMMAKGTEKLNGVPVAQLLEKAEAREKGLKAQQQNYMDLSAARFSQARRRSLSLATNGISDDTMKAIEDKEVNGAKKAVAKENGSAEALRKKRFADKHPNLAKVNKGASKVASATKTAAKYAGMGVVAMALQPVTVYKLASKAKEKASQKHLLKQINNENLPNTKRDLALEKLDLKIKKKEYGKGSSEYKEQRERYEAVKEREHERVAQLREEYKKSKELVKPLRNSSPDESDNIFEPTTIIYDDNHSASINDSATQDDENSNYKRHAKTGYIKKKNQYYAKTKIPKSKSKKKK